jgi:hypothetical protein
MDLEPRDSLTKRRHRGEPDQAADSVLSLRADHLQVITADFTQYDFEEKGQYVESLVRRQAPLRKLMTPPHARHENKVHTHPLYRDV